jgi:hypothetical protein
MSLLTKRKFVDDGKPLTHGNKKDVGVLPSRLQSLDDFNSNALKIEAKQKKFKEDADYNKGVEEKERERERERKREEERKRKEEDEIDESVDLSYKSLQISNRKSIKDVISYSSENPDTVWLLVDKSTNTKYSVGIFKGKYDFSDSGLNFGIYVSIDDRSTFYQDSKDLNKRLNNVKGNILVFYEFEHAVFLPNDLKDKYFEIYEEEDSEKKKYPVINKKQTEETKKNLDNKKMFVVDETSVRRRKIREYLGIKSEWITESPQTFKPYISFYEIIVPMVQRYLELNPKEGLVYVGARVNIIGSRVINSSDCTGTITSINDNFYTIEYDRQSPNPTKVTRDEIQVIGNVDNAIAQLPSLEKKVEQIVEQIERKKFDGEKYAEGAYMNTIITPLYNRGELLSPAVAAVAEKPFTTAAQAATSAAATSAAATSAAAAAPSSSSWGSNIFRFGNQALSSAADVLTHTVNHGFRFPVGPRNESLLLKKYGGKRKSNKSKKSKKSKKSRKSLKK